MTNRRAVALAALGYVLVAVAYTWPLAVRLGGVPHDPGDPLLTTWFLWWSGTQAIPLTAAWWNAPAFYPATGVLAFSEHLLGLAPIAAPLIALTHQPLIGHNVAFISTFVLSALGAHFLAYTLTRRHDVSAVAAVAFAFAPYRLPQSPHIQVLASQWTPFCLAALHRYDQTSRRRWIVAAAAAWVLQGLSCGYFLIFLWLMIAMWLLWFGVGRWSLGKLGIAGAALGAASLVLLPFLIGYQTILRDTYGFRRSIGEIRYFSADIASLLSASGDLLVWPWVDVIQRPESNIFPGLTIVILCAFALRGSHPLRVTRPESRWIPYARRFFVVVVIAAAIAGTLPLLYGSSQLTIGGVRLISVSRPDKPLTFALVAALALLALLPGVRDAWRRRSIPAFYALAAFATWILALGPDPSLMNQRAFYRAPYSWLMMLPGFDGLRVPARLWTMTLVCIAVVGALAVHRLQGRRRQVIVIAAVAGLLLDGWPRHFVVVAAPPLRHSPPGVAARLDLPIDEITDPHALYQQMFDPVPLYNGFSGYTAPHYAAMRSLLEAGDVRILQVLASRGPLGVVIDHAGDADGGFKRMVLSVPGATMEHTESDWSSYRLPPAGAVPDVPDRSGTSIPIASVSASPNAAAASRAIDGHLDTTWSGGEQRKPSSFTIELSQSSRVSQVVTELGEFWGDFPVSLRIDVSADGAQWDTVHDGDTMLNAYFAALRHPKEMPIVLPINRDNVRFIRMQQTGSSKRNWSIAEVQVVR